MQEILFCGLFGMAGLVLLIFKAATRAPSTTRNVAGGLFKMMK